MKKTLFLFCFALLGLFFAPTHAAQANSVCNVDGVRWCVNDQPDCSAICDFIPNQTCNLELVNCDDSQIIQFGTIDAQGVFRGCQGATPQEAGCTSMDDCEAQTVETCQDLNWAVTDETGRVLECYDNYTSAQTARSGTEGDIDVTDAATCQTALAQAQGGTGGGQTGQQATQPTDSGVCSGTRCTRDEVGVFMQNVPSGCYNRGNCSLQDIQIVFVNVSNFVLSIVGSLAFLFYIIGGIMFLTAGGSQKQISRGKDMLKYATVGLIIVLVAFAGIQWLTTALGVESEFLERSPFG